MAMKAKTKVRGARHDPLDKQVLADRHPEHKKAEKPSKGDVRAKKRDKQQDYISEDLSKKILSQAREQLDDASDSDDIPDDEAPALPPKQPLARPGAESDDEQEDLSEDEEEYNGDVQLNPEDEQAMAMFMTQEEGPKRTLADAVMEKLRALEGGFSGSKDQVEDAVVRTMNPKVVQVYRGVGEFLHSYTVGKLPKAFKIVPVLSNWEEILFLTKPEEWSPSATYQATRLFASNLNQRMAQRFYSLILLPRVRQDIEEHHRLHFWLYMALKKALYKSAAFYKGILLPLCEAGDCTLREAVIVGSVLSKVSIPLLQSSAALLKLGEMPYSGANSVFIRVLLDKKYALPHRVLGGLVNHFLLFANDQRALPVLWHQALLTLVQRYKNDLNPEQKDAIRALIRIKSHHAISDEIRRELAAAQPNVVPMQG